MTSSNLGNVVDYLRRIVSPFPGNVSDNHLLSHFVANRDEAAFSALLKRHGPMVFGVSRGVLSSPQDAEDVVQATFLLLARKAATIRRRASVGCWLHGVARRLSLQLKRKEMARLKRETGVSALRSKVASPPVTAHELQEVLNDALQELPEKYRAALILCYLEGQTQEQAAVQLGCPLGTVRSRLAGGRKLLQTRLTRRGFTLSAAGLATLITVQTVSARLPTKLFASTVHAAARYASGTPLRGLVSASVGWLVKSGLHSVALTKLIWVSVGIVGMGLVAGGMGLAARSGQFGGRDLSNSNRQTENQAQRELAPKSTDIEVEKPRTDRWGDSLPAGALTRIGSVRLRHGDEIKNLGFSPDGQTILSADWHGIHVWDAATGRHLRRFGDPRHWQFDSIAVSADCRIVALSMQDGPFDHDVQVWDAATARLLYQFKGGRFARVELSPDGKILAVFKPGEKDDGFWRFFDASTGKERHELDGNKLQSVIFAKDSKTLINVSNRESIEIWDTVTGKLERQFVGRSSDGEIALSPDGKTLATVSATHVVLWDLVAGKETHRLAGRPFALTFSPASKTIISSDYKAIHCWDVATGKELPERSLPAAAVRAMAFSPDGNTLATGGAETTIQLWDVAKGKEKLTSGDPVSFVEAISPDGKTVASSGRDKIMRLWDTTSGKEIRQFASEERNDRFPIAFVGQGRRLLSSDNNETLQVWEIATGKELRRIPFSAFIGLSNSFGSALSSDGKLFAVQGKDALIQVLSLDTAHELRKLPATQQAFLAFSPDGRMVYTYEWNKKVHIWEIATGKELVSFEGHSFREQSDRDDRVLCVKFSPDGNLVAFGGEFHHQIALYEMRTGKKVRLLHVPRLLARGVRSLAFSADNRVLATGEASGAKPGGMIHLWEMVTGQEFRQFVGDNGGVVKMAFSDDGKLLLSCNSDTTALIWDLTGTRTGPKAHPVTAEELETVWSDLSAADAVRGQKAVRTLLGVPDQAVALLAKKLKPASTPDAKILARCLAELDSDRFKTRGEAMRELENMGDVTAPAIRNALAGTPSLELKNRLESLIEKFSTSQRLRTLRAVQALEQVGTSSSQALLKRLAEGVDSLLTREAKAAVERLATVHAAKM